MSEELSLAASAYHQLEEKIVTLALKPGETLTESRLTTELGMGRTPIREALQRLSWEGLISVRPRQGIVISELHPADFKQVIDARHPLELLLTIGSSRLASPEQRSQLRSCASAMGQSAAEGDQPAFMRQDKRFDEIIAEAACNPFAAKALAPLQTISRRFWFRYFRDQDLTRAADQHVALMRAIEDGDEALVRDRTNALMGYMQDRAVGLTGEVSATL